MRAKAERKAEIDRFLVTAGKALTWPQKVAMVAQNFRPEGASKPNLTRLLKAVEGVDPINFAPGPFARSQGVATRCRHVARGLGLFHDHLARCWRGVPADTGVARCARRVYQAGLAMAVAGDCLAALGSPTTGATVHARRGRVEITTALAQPAMRDKTTINALDWVSLARMFNNGGRWISGSILAMGGRCARLCWPWSMWRQTRCWISP